YGTLSFTDGRPDQTNFDRYKIIRQQEAPKAIEVHFVKNEIDPTGLGEPPFPPVMGALANALYKATGRRHYSQPFGADKPPIVGEARRTNKADRCCAQTDRPTIFYGSSLDQCALWGKRQKIVQALFGL